MNFYRDFDYVIKLDIVLHIFWTNRIILISINKLLFLSNITHWRRMLPWTAVCGWSYTRAYFHCPFAGWPIGKPDPTSISGWCVNVFPRSLCCGSCWRCVGKFYVGERVRRLLEVVKLCKAQYTIILPTLKYMIINKRSKNVFY